MTLAATLTDSFVSVQVYDTPRCEEEAPGRLSGLESHHHHAGRWETHDRLSGDGRHSAVSGKDIGCISVCLHNVLQLRHADLLQRVIVDMLYFFQVQVFLCSNKLIQYESIGHSIKHNRLRCFVIQTFLLVFKSAPWSPLTTRSHSNSQPDNLRHATPSYRWLAVLIPAKNNNTCVTCLLVHHVCELKLGAIFVPGAGKTGSVCSDSRPAGLMLAYSLTFLNLLSVLYIMSSMIFHIKIYGILSCTEMSQ